jgi:mRNA interferase RelE/StbE
MRQMPRRKPVTSRALVGVEQSRVRVQDFRILFTETAETITVHNIDPRGGIYD